jgi:hypothetical protein
MLGLGRRESGRVPSRRTGDVARFPPHATDQTWKYRTWVPPRGHTLFLHNRLFLSRLSPKSLTPRCQRPEVAPPPPRPWVRVRPVRGRSHGWAAGPCCSSWRGPQGQHVEAGRRQRATPCKGSFVDSSVARSSRRRELPAASSVPIPPRGSGDRVAPFPDRCAGPRGQHADAGRRQRVTPYANSVVGSSTTRFPVGTSSHYAPAMSLLEPWRLGILLPLLHFVQTVTLYIDVHRCCISCISMLRRFILMFAWDVIVSRLCCTRCEHVAFTSLACCKCPMQIFQN